MPSASVVKRRPRPPAATARAAPDQKPRPGPTVVAERIGNPRRVFVIGPVTGATVAAAYYTVWKSNYGAFVLNHRVVLHAIDATPARWRGDAGSSPLD